MSFLDAPTPLAFAHRGFSPGGAENSMAAFQAAVDLGYRYLETDVRVSADGVALAFHDATLDRLTDRRGKVSDLPWAEVRRARINGLEPIPLLEDVLAGWPEVRVNLDVKAKNSVGPTADAIKRTGTLERVCVGAFSAARIGAMRVLLGPRLCTSLGPRQALWLRYRSSRAVGGAAGNRCAQVPARIGRFAFIDERYIQIAHRAGLQVHAWTVNDAHEMERLLDLGIDAIMTDRADVLRDLLRDRGQWHGR